jgi:hypothetical protein
MTAARAATPALERRRERRVPVHLAIVVRGTDRTGLVFEERTSSENLCRGGAAFASRHQLDLGGHLEIHIPALPTSASEDTEFSTQGRIVHLMLGSGDDQIIVGVEFTGPHFHSMYVSEAAS